ncbi:MAG: HNH endonuclease [Mycoplasmoidaceae bacterium]
MSYRPNTDRLWSQSAKCDCGKQDCNEKNHRLCPRCNNKMLYGSHFSVEKLNKSDYAWNVDLIIPKIDGGNNKLNNLVAVHIKCNNSRNRKDQSNEY